MPEIPLPLSSSPGLRPAEGAGRLINAFVERLGDGSYSRRRVPGLSLLANTGHSGCRGFHYVGDVLLAAMGAKLVKIESDFTFEVLGDLAGTGRVTFASNNKSPTPDILCVTSSGIYTVTISGAPVSFIDADLPQPNSICFIDGYFMATIRDGRVFASGLNNTSFAALDFATAEGKPGGLYRGLAFGQMLYLFGPKGIEPWRNAGNETGFPFSRSTVIPLGLVAPFAIAGHEDGFSAALLLVGNDRRVWRIDGGAPTPVSTPDVDRALAAVADPDDITALVFSAAGHAHWCVTGPGFTWVLDLSTEQWHERASWLQPNWRAACSVNAFDRWVVGDRTTDHLGLIDEDIYREYTAPLVFTVISMRAKAFPNRLNIPRLDAEFVVGQGLPTGTVGQTRPTVNISYAKDGGNVFSTPMIRNLGGMGEYRTRIHVDRLGLTGPMGIVVKFETADDIYVALMSASHEVEARPR